MECRSTSKASAPCGGWGMSPAPSGLGRVKSPIQQENMFDPRDLSVRCSQLRDLYIAPSLRHIALFSGGLGAQAVCWQYLVVPCHLRVIRDIVIRQWVVSTQFCFFEVSKLYHGWGNGRLANADSLFGMRLPGGPENQRRPASHIVATCNSLALPQETPWWQLPVFDPGARWQPKTPSRWRAPGALLPVATSEDTWTSMRNRCECASVGRSCAHTNANEAPFVGWPCLSGA